MLAPSVYAANTSIHYYNQTKVYYELNVDTTPGYLKLNFYTNETPPPPVEVFLRKGTGENQSGVFNITNLTISGRDYGAGFDNFQRCILNLEEGTNLNMSGYADISGKLSATNANITAEYLSKIFITDNGDAIAFDQDLTNITVTDQLGNEFQDVVFDFNEDGNVIGIASVPEPSTYAAVFSLLAAAFAV